MKVAIVGSRTAPSSAVELILQNLPAETTEIVSGGARGIDRMAAAIAHSRGLLLKEFLPDYDRYGRRAPLVRNDLIVQYADVVLAFWDGESHGTGYTVSKCRQVGKPVRIISLPKEGK